jgi:hypothetical protein
MTKAVGFLAKDRLLDYSRFCFYAPWMIGAGDFKRFQSKCFQHYFSNMI